MQCFPTDGVLVLQNTAKYEKLLCLAVTPEYERLMCSDRMLCLEMMSLQNAKFPAMSVTLSLSQVGFLRMQNSVFVLKNGF